MKTYWRPGETCVVRGIINDKVWIAHSVIVVKDDPAETALCLLPGAMCAVPTGYTAQRSAGQSDLRRWEMARDPALSTSLYPWRTNRVLMFLWPEKFYSCWLFWNGDTNAFSSYYINFQLPYKRSHCGFDTLDLDLDIVVNPDYTWVWKDEDEYQDGIADGGIRAEWVDAIEQSQPEVFEMIRARAYPLDGSWVDWRPDPAWAPSQLPAGWREV